MPSTTKKNRRALHRAVLDAGFRRAGLASRLSTFRASQVLLPAHQYQDATGAVLHTCPYGPIPSLSEVRASLPDSAIALAFIGWCSGLTGSYLIASSPSQQAFTAVTVAAFAIVLFFLWKLAVEDSATFRAMSTRYWSRVLVVPDPWIATSAAAVGDMMQAISSAGFDATVFDLDDVSWPIRDRLIPAANSRGDSLFEMVWVLPAAAT